MATSSTTINVIVTQVGTPIIRPTPAKPLNSLSKAPTQARTSVPTESHAQPRPKWSRMSSACPLRRTIQNLIEDPMAERMRAIAEKSGVPVVGVTETEPTGKNYQAWMMSELDAVDRALRKQTP